MKELFGITTRQSNILTTPYVMPKKARDMIYITVCFTVKKNPNVDALEKAFNNLVKTQDALRTRIIFTKTGYKQYIEDFKYESIPVIELKSKDELENAIYTNKTLGSFVNAQLYKAIIFKYDNQATLMMVFNHLIYDGYSIGLTFNQICNDYKIYAIGKEPKEVENYSITNFYKEDNKYRKSKRNREDVKYWRNAINDRKGYRIIIPVFKITPVNRRTFEILNDDYSKAYKLCKELKITMPSLIASVAAITLGKFLNRNDFSFAHNSYGRNYLQKNSIGCYVAIFLSFYHLNNDETVEKFIKDSYNSYLQSMRHMNTTAIQIALNCLKTEIKLMRFNSWGLSFSYLYTDLINTDEYEYEMIQHRYQPNQFYCLINDDSKRTITFDLIYQTKLVSEENLDIIINNFKILFNKIVNNKNMLIGDIVIENNKK